MKSDRFPHRRTSGHSGRFESRFTQGLALASLGLMGALTCGPTASVAASSPEYPAAVAAGANDIDVFELPRDVRRTHPPTPGTYDPMLGISWGAAGTTEVLPDVEGNVFIRPRLQQFAGSQVALHRFGAGWQIIEPDLSSGTVHWERTDAILDEIELVGGEPVFILSYGSPGLEGEDCNGNTTYNRDIPPSDFDEWIEFVAAVVERYGDRVRYYEIWNEPDWFSFFEGPVERFSRIVVMADSVVHANDPIADTILGGVALPPFQGSSWLAKLLQQPKQPAFDVLGVHGYGSNQVMNLQLVDEAYQIAGLSTAGIRIWVTESGAPAEPANTTSRTPYANPRGQEAYVPWTLSRWADPRVEAVLWYRAWDKDDGYSHGLIDVEGVARPSLGALKSWTPKNYESQTSVAFNADFESLSAAERFDGLYPIMAATVDGNGFVDDLNAWVLHDQSAIVDGALAGFAVIDPSDAGAGKYAGIYFGVDDTWRYDAAQDFVVTVQFKPGTTPDFRIRYQQAGGSSGILTPDPFGCESPDPDVARSTDYDVIIYPEDVRADWSTTTSEWFEYDEVTGGPSYAPEEAGLQTATFILEDMALANGGFQASDFRIELRPDETTPLWIASVTIAPRLFAAEEPATVGLDIANSEPYSVLTLDYNEDDYQDLLFTVAARNDAQEPHPLVFAGEQPTSPGVARFTPLPSPVPSGFGVAARGAAYARLSPSGGLRLLLATPATNSRLFKFENGQFQPDAAFTFSPGVWGGSFGDMDLDGDMDLYLARSQAAAGVGSAVLSVDIAGRGMEDQLLEYRYGTYVDVTATALPYTGTSETVAATWGDVNGDRFPDLYVSYLGNGSTATDAFRWSPLYINLRDGTFMDESYTAPGGSPVDPQDPPEPTVYTQGATGELGKEGIHRLTRVSGARFVDLDNDGDVDFVASRDSEMGYRGLVTLISRHQNSGFFDDLGTAEVLRPQRDAVVIDLDNNAVLDFVGAPPGSSSDAVGTLMGATNSQGEVVWINGSGRSGLSPGASGGISAADFDGDHDIDLVFGRDEDRFGREHYYFSNVADNSGNQILVELDAAGSGNPELGVGARVLVTAGGITQMRQFSGGDGRGSQQPLLVRFGIGSAASAQVIVRWPDGSTQESTVTAGARIKFTDDHVPELDGESVGVLLDLDPTSVVMHFEWETRYATSSNTLRIEKTGGDSPCLFGYTGVKGFGSSTIEFTVEDTAPSGFSYERRYDFESQLYVHKLNYQRDCAAPCYYRYKVISVSADRVENSGWKTLGLPGCVIIQQP